MPGMVVLTKNGSKPEELLGASNVNSVVVPAEPSAGESPSKPAVVESIEEGNGSKKRTRDLKRVDSESSESDAVSRKQIIVPSDDSKLLVAQNRRSRSVTTKKKTNNRE